MGFSDDLAAFNRKAEKRLLAVFHGVSFEAHRSIVEGSPLTGAPGQPVDEGTLKKSFQLAWQTPTRVRIASELKYAGAVEDGIGSTGKPVTYGKGGNGRSSKAPAKKGRAARGAQGGSHSLKMTVAGFPKIVAHVNASVPK